MGLGTSKYETEVKEYEIALAEWEEVCAAMAAEEAAAAYDASMGGCGLTLYCAQQCAGVALELPCRVLWHSGCAGLCCAGTWCALAGQRCDRAGDGRWALATQALVAHHTAHVQAYNALGSFLCENVCVHPCAPVDLYKPDVTLARPPRPTPPERPCDCGRACAACAGGLGLAACCCAGDGGGACDCAAAEQLLLRRMRAMLCVLALGDCGESCHASACCGPWAPFGCLLAAEGEAERLGRWAEEGAAQREARTAAFHARRAAEPERYSYSRHPLTGHVAAVIQRPGSAGDGGGAFASSPIHAEPAAAGADATAATAELVDPVAPYSKMER